MASWFQRQLRKEEAKKKSGSSQNQLNTYNASTGVYTDDSGKQFSMINPPEGAAIIFDKSAAASGKKSSGGGSYNQATGTYTDTSGKGYSMAQAPTGAEVVNVQQQQAAIKQQQQARQEQQAFSGKVEVYDEGGVKQQEQYLIKGKQAGTIDYTGKEPTAKTKIASRFMFNRSDQQQTVVLKSGGAGVQTTEFVASFPEDISTVLSPATASEQQGMTYDVNNGIYTDASGKGYSMGIQQVPLDTKLIGKTTIIGTTKQISNRDATYRQSLSTGERLKAVIETTIDKKKRDINIPALIIRVPSELAQIGLEKTGLNKKIPSSINVPVSTQLPENLVATALFMHPSYLGASGGKAINTFFTGYGIKTATNKNLSTTERIIGGAIAVGGVGVPVFRYLNKEVKIGTTPKMESFSFKAPSAIMKKGEQVKTVGQFNVVSVNAPRYSVYVKRRELIRNELFGVAPPRGPKVLYKKSFRGTINLEDAGKLKLSYNKVIVKPYSELSLGVSMVEPFYVSQSGNILGPTRREGLPLVQVTNIKVTPTKGKTFYSALEGFTEPRDYKVNLAKDKLAQIPRTAFEQIETLGGGNGVKVLQKYPREATLSMGEIKTQKLFKFDSKGNIKLFKSGRTINRGALLGVRTQVTNQEFPREFGLMERTSYAETVGFVDTTIPRLRRPKRGLRLEGASTESYYNFPEETKDVRFIQTGGKKSSQGYLQNLYTPKLSLTSQQKQVLQKQVYRTAFTQSNNKMAIITTKQVESTNLPSVSRYAGTGLYERTDGGQLPPSVSAGRSFSITNVYTPTASTTKTLSVTKNTFISRDLNKELSRNTQRNVNRNVNREINRTMNREIAREVTREIQRPIQRTNLRTTQRLTQRITQRIIEPPPVIKTPKTPYSPTRTPKTPMIFSNKKGGENMGLGKFTVFLRRFGKFSPIGTTKTYQEAFNLGKFKTRTTLGATFKVEGKGAKQPTNIFGYKTKKTKEGLLFIEQPKYRLSTRPEVKEIQIFKKMKGGRRK